MTRVYYREAVGAFVVFDCTRPRTFDSVGGIRLSVLLRCVLALWQIPFDHQCLAFDHHRIILSCDDIQVTKWKQDIDQKVVDASGTPVPVVLLMVLLSACLKLRRHTSRATEQV
jgi:hypothetical protein